jgi:hypothetical protein
MILSDGMTIAVTVTNISDDGCQIAFERHQTVPIGTEVRLKLEEQSLAATVRWALNGGAGLRFSRQLNEG